MRHGPASTTRLCLAALVLVAGASAKSLRTYHIGCSTTDNTTQCADPTNYARSLGDTHHWAKCTQLGCGMECVYINTLINGNRLHELSDSSWDGVVCASYPNGAHLGVAVDLAYSDSCYQQALKTNPDCILYLSGVWTYNEGRPWNDEWLNTTAPDYDPRYHANYTSKKWHEDYIKAAQAKYGPSRARLLPFAHAMAKLNDRILSGGTTVLSSVYQLYLDGIHLNEKGVYLCAAVQYAVLFNADPHGAARTFMYFDKQATVDETYANLAWDIAWETVNELSAWTRVGNTGGVKPVAVTAVRPAHAASGPVEVFTISGRAARSIGGTGRAASARTAVYVMTRDGLRLLTGAER